MSQLLKAALPHAAFRPFAAQSTRAAPALRWAAVTCVLLSTACMPTRPALTATEFVIVRHAEKRSDDPRDPLLTEAGLARANRLAVSLAAHPVGAVYATAYRRTQQTAAPVAADHGLGVTTYDAKQDAKALAGTLRQRHVAGTVVVVGHSNTVPDIAAALCECVVAPIGDDEFDRRLQVRIGGEGKVTLVDSRTP